MPCSLWTISHADGDDESNTGEDEQVDGGERASAVLIFMLDERRALASQGSSDHRPGGERASAEDIRLTGRETAILRALIEADGRVPGEGYRLAPVNYRS